MNRLEEFIKLLLAMNIEPAETTPVGFHSHRCPSCGHTWCHADDVPVRSSFVQNRKAHTCAKCGTEQYWKFARDVDPMTCSGGVRF